MTSLLSIVILLGIKTVTSSTSTPFFQSMINDMSVHFDGDNEYFPEFFEELKTCVTRWDDDELEDAINESWKGLVSFYQNKSVSDPWIDCLEDPNNDRCYYYWDEGESQSWSFFGDEESDSEGNRTILIMQPCNYASSVVYYHTALRICKYDNWKGDVESGVPNLYVKAIKRGFFTLAFGSSFLHGSNTDVGSLMDNMSIGFIVFTGYDFLSETIGFDTNVLRCLSTNATIEQECESSLALSDNLPFIALNHSVYKWYDELQDSFTTNLYNYEKTLACMTSIVFDMIFSSFPSASEFLTKLIGSLLLYEEDLDWLVNEYKPDTQPYLKNFSLTFIEKWKFGFKAAGTLTKLVMAGLWEENFFSVDLPYIALRISVRISPVINMIATVLNSYYGRSSNEALGYNLYPGSSTCNTSSRHAFWHQQSGQVISDLIFFFEEFTSTLAGAKKIK